MHCLMHCFINTARKKIKTKFGFSDWNTFLYAYCTSMFIGSAYKPCTAYTKTDVNTLFNFKVGDWYYIKHTQWIFDNYSIIMPKNNHFAYTGQEISVYQLNHWYCDISRIKNLTEIFFHVNKDLPGVR